MKRAVFCALLGAVALGGCAYGPPYGGYDQGYGYSYPAYGYSAYGAPGSYYGAPGYLYGSTTINIDGRSRTPHAERRFGRGGASGDIDRDGIPNNIDVDRDGDGVNNRFDSRPNNPRRR